MIEIYWSQHCDLQDWLFGFKGQFFQSDLHIFVSINSCEGILYEQSLCLYSLLHALCAFRRYFLNTWMNRTKEPWVQWDVKRLWGAALLNRLWLHLSKQLLLNRHIKTQNIIIEIMVHFSLFAPHRDVTVDKEKPFLCFKAVWWTLITLAHSQ